MEKRTRRGAGNLILAYALVGILFMGAWAFLSRPINVDKTYNDQKLKQDVKEGKVTAVIVQQNEEIPTGTVEVTFKEGVKVYYTQDVSLTIGILSGSDVEYEITDVNRAGLLEKLAPYIFISILFVVYITVTSTQMASISGGIGGGGANSNQIGRAHV